MTWNFGNPFSSAATNAVQQVAQPQQGSLQGVGTSYPLPSAPPGYSGWISYESDVGCVFRVDAIENGYLVRATQHPGEVAKTYYAEDMKAVGDRITTLMVAWNIAGT